MLHLEGKLDVGGDDILNPLIWGVSSVIIQSCNINIGFVKKLKVTQYSNVFVKYICVHFTMTSTWVFKEIIAKKSFRNFKNIAKLFLLRFVEADHQLWQTAKNWK